MLKGIRTESDCHEVAVKLINDSKHLFCSSREHALCLKSAQIVFDADILTTILEPSREGLDILQECHAAGHEIFILSNFGKEKFQKAIGSVIKMPNIDWNTIFFDMQPIVGQNKYHSLTK